MYLKCFAIFIILSTNHYTSVFCDDIIGCGGFIKSEVEINFSLIEVKLYTKQGTKLGSLKYQTDCAPNNGYYMVPVYDKGEYSLRVEPPEGWTFEPMSFDLMIDGKTDKCSRSEDINFQFTGFGVVGQVVSKGQSDGPAGVKLILKKSGTQDVVKQTTSKIGGAYTFEKVLPGNYDVEASHPTWKFETASSLVSVSRQTGDAGSSIVVAGFDVQGRLLSDGEPVQGVFFALFTSQSNAKQNLQGCSNSKLDDSLKIDGAKIICHVKSSADGIFHFPAVPFGQYTLVPFYKGERIKYDVAPNQLAISVGQDSLTIQEPFQVAGFIVAGRVKTSPKGQGIPEAKVIVNGEAMAVTQADGSYQLDSMKSGSYQLTVEAPRLVFDRITVKITPNTPQLPDIVASRFQVCGNIIIDKFPAGMSSELRVKTIKIRKESGEEYQTVTSGVDGQFCANCHPGKYAFSVSLTDSEMKGGLKLLPDERHITVGDQPVDGIFFSQFHAKISGAIHCLENCGLIQLSLFTVSRSEDRKIIEASSNGHQATFAFDEVTTGKYQVSVLNDHWCWKNKSLDVEVVDRDVNNVEFAQFGYMLSCSLSHNAVLNFEHESKTNDFMPFNLTKGVNKFCLPQPGVYHVTLESCHQFEQEVYHYDTSTSSVLALTAVSHLVNITVVTQTMQNDIVVTISNSPSTGQDVVVGPLKLELAEIPADNTTKPVEPTPLFHYKYQHWSRGGETLLVTATSGQLLFQPTSVELSVRSDICPGGEVVINGRQGMFLDGQIHPPLESVLVTISTVGEADKKIEVLSDANGLYHVGPVDGDLKYEVDAQMDGYVFTPIANQPGHFQSFKLAEIIVQVAEEGSGLALSGVLLSLSGGTRYRQNNITQEGSMIFSSLSPGEYFLKPMMKEYDFEPRSRMIEVTEGASVSLTVFGKRVAFSCYGSVVSLNGEAEPGVVLEAVGESPETCRTHQEETKTEQDGSFRLRGLKPGCDYIIRMKSDSGKDDNPHIERSSPKAKTIRVTDQDITGLNIIAFRRINQMDVSGHVVTTQEHVNSLKVHLSLETNVDSPLHSLSLGVSPFFYFSSISVDNQSYVLRLTSSLSKSSYEYEMPQVQFFANTSFKHFNFQFSPKHKLNDQELSHSSFLVLPLTILILYIAYNYRQVLPFVSQYASSFLTMVSRPSALSHSSNQPQQYAASDPLIVPADLVDSSNLRKKQKAKKI